MLKTVLESATLKLKNEALNPNARHHFFGSIYADQYMQITMYCLALSGWKICTESLMNHIFLF